MEVVSHHGLEEPLKPAEAKPRIRQIVEQGNVSSCTHSRQEMKNDKLDMGDCLNVLRGGVVRPAELVKGTWRYPVHTNRICVVVAFTSPDSLVIVTAWRIK